MTTEPGTWVSNRFLASLSPVDIETLEPWLSRVSLSLGETVQRLDDVVDTVYFPVKAILSVVTMMVDGRGVESFSIGRESGYGLVNCLGAKSGFSQVVAQVPGEVWCIPVARLKAAAEQSPAIRNLIVRHAQAHAAMAEQSAACNALHQVNARLSRWLLLSQDRAGSDTLPLTQEFLGLMLGVRRTTVTLAAQALSAAGLIRYSRGRLEILDRAGLEHASCECYGTVNRRYAELLGGDFIQTDGPAG